MIHRALAADHTAAAIGFVEKINEVILYPLIQLLMGIAFVVFLWGAYQYLSKANEPSARQDGQRHMMYGIIGFVVMLSAYTILAIAIRTFFGNGAVPDVV